MNTNVAAMFCLAAAVQMNQTQRYHTEAVRRGGNQMRMAAIVAYAFVAVFIFRGDPALADAKQIGPTFYSNGIAQGPYIDALGFFVSDPFDTCMALMAQSVAPNEDDKMLLGFCDKDDWAKFVSFWTKARRAKRPTDAEVYSNANDVDRISTPSTKPT